MGFRGRGEWVRGVTLPSGLLAGSRQRSVNFNAATPVLMAVRKERGLAWTCGGSRHGGSSKLNKLAADLL